MSETEASGPSWTISVGDEATLSVSEIWPDGDAPDNPTIDDVIAQIKETPRYSFASEWGLDGNYISVNGREVYP